MSAIKRLPEPVFLAAVVVVGIVVVWGANHFGLWWITAVVGLGLGLMIRGALRLLALAALVAVAGWGLALAWQSFGTDIGGAAAVVATIMGFGRSGFLVVLLALIFAALLALAGAWLGAALRRVWPLAARLAVRGE